MGSLSRSTWARRYGWARLRSRTSHFGDGLRGHIVRITLRLLRLRLRIAGVTHAQVERRTIATEHKIERESNTADQQQYEKNSDDELAAPATVTLVSCFSRWRVQPFCIEHHIFTADRMSVGGSRIGLSDADTAS